MARPENAAEISRVLIASVRELCTGDQGNSPAALADWLANKSEDGVSSWLSARHSIWLRVDRKAIAAVGAFSAEGEILLLYVAPRYRLKGHSAALLRHLEREIARAGHAEAFLTSTGTAHAFYPKHGWRDDGPAVDCHLTDGQPMRKVLGAQSGDSVP